MRLWRGMASKALLMSNVTRSVLCGGLAVFMPSKVLCVSSVSRVFVEWRGLKPCCEGARGMWGVMLFRMSRSRTLDGVQSRVMGRWEEGSVGSLFGLGKVMIFPCFQMFGIVL